MARKGQKLRKYDWDFKIKIIKQNIEEGKPTQYLSKKYSEVATKSWRDY